MQNDSDLKFLKLVAKGDSKAFESLLHNYQDLVFGYCVRMLKNRQKAEDLTQETWMRVLRHSENFKPTGSVKSWIMSIARNLVIDEFRASKKWIDLDEGSWNSLEDPQDGIEKIFLENEKSELLQKAFLELPENQKIILTMVLVEGLSQSEVAFKLNCSVGAIKATLFRARENLKEQVGGYNG